MQRAIELALKGRGKTWPNPMVGAVVVDKNGEIIGEGYHKKYGEAHAEVNAIESVKDKSALSEATIYVTLEPCSHYGKTPPCADLIIKNCIKHVVVGSTDPNPKVDGGGIKKLKEAGIKVTTGVMEDECRDINPQFFVIHEKKRPYIILKWAQSSDLFLDIVRPRGTRPAWLTGEDAKRLVHRWRAECDAIMVGRHTVELDDPQLTARLTSNENENEREREGRNPLRVILDRHLQLHPLHRVFDSEAPTLIFTESASKVAHSATQTIDYSIDILPQVLEELMRRDIRSILVEGGGQLLNSFIKNELWDEARVFTTNRSIVEYYSRTYNSMGIKAPEIDGELVETNEELGLKILRQTPKKRG